MERGKRRLANLYEESSELNKGELERNLNSISYKYTISNGIEIKPFCSTTINCIKNLSNKKSNLSIQYELDNIGQHLIDDKIIKIENKSNDSIQIKSTGYTKATEFKITIKDLDNGSTILNNQLISLIEV